MSGVETSEGSAVGAAVALRSRRTNGVREKTSIVIDGCVELVVVLIKTALCSDG